MRQSLSLSRPATVKLLHITLRTLHNWESGKVRIPYAAFKLIRLFSSYPIFHPIWKDWRIVGSRLITPEGHSLETGNFHWLSLMARKAEAFTKVNQQLRDLTASVRHGNIADKGANIAPCLPDYRDKLSSSKSASLGLTMLDFLPPISNTGGKTPFTGGKAEQNHVHGTPESSQNRPCRAFARKRHFAHFPDFIPPPAPSPLTQQMIVGG